MIWQSYPLSEISVDIQPGFARQPKGGETSLPHLRTNNVSPEGRMNLSLVKEVPANTREIERYSLIRGDVLFNNTNSSDLVGKTAFFDLDGGPYLFSNHMTRVRLKEEVADPRFVARYLFWTWKTGGFRMLVSRWVNQAAINKNMLGGLSITLPSISEQRRIVEILDQADALRRTRTEADAKASRILPALFHKMFGDPIINSRGWQEIELGNLCEHITSGSRGWATYTGKGNSRFLRTQDIVDGEIADDLMSLDAPEGAEAVRTLLRDGDVVITITGMVGKAAVFRNRPQNVYVSQHVALLRPKSEIVPEYLVGYANFPAGNVPILARFQYGQTKPGLGFRELQTTMVPKPPKSLQETFREAYWEIRHVRNNLLKSGKHLESLWTNLLHSAFTGDLTAKWRMAHMKELLAEMEAQAKYLSGSAH
jgi:type I restriction enzyme, S subunit